MTTLAPTLHAPRDRAHALARAHGWNATAFQGLGEGFSYYFYEDGVVAYVDTGAAWVAAGAPVCSEIALARTVDAFVAAARAARRRCCFFGVEPRLLDATRGALESVRIGEQPAWNPKQWPDTLARHATLREQLRRARAKGVVVRPAPAPERALHHNDLHELRARWLATRAMPPMGFLVTVPPAFESVEGMRFVAWRGDRIVGVACMIPVPARSGWFIEQLLRDPAAPNGTVELLVDAAMRWADSMGSSWLTLGLAPLAGEVPAPLRLARRRLRWLYDFEGLRRFKAKLRPNDWIPIHLAYPRSQGVLASTIDALTAFASGGMTRFGARFVRRGHPAVLGALAALLVPWTLLLATSSATHWFAGHSSVKWAWVAFDVGVTAGIVRLLSRPSWRLATVVAAAVTVDALLTPIEAAMWNVPRVTGWFDVAVIILACAAPLLAAFALWGAAARLRRVR